MPNLEILALLLFDSHRATLETTPNAAIVNELTIIIQFKAITNKILGTSE